MLSEQQLNELKRIYGDEQGAAIVSVFDELSMYMDYPAASFGELVSYTHYRRVGMTQVRFEEIVRNAAVESALRNYAERLRDNAARDLNPHIGVGDIATVLRADNRALYTRVGGGWPRNIITSRGKRANTGQYNWSWER